MKRFFIYVLFIFCLIFGFKSLVYAKDLKGTLYVNTTQQLAKYSDRLNLFKMVYDSSGFTENLLLQGKDFVKWSFNELNLSDSIIDDSSNYYASLLSKSDFYYLNMSFCSSGECSSYDNIYSAESSLSAFVVMSSDSGSWLYGYNFKTGSGNYSSAYVYYSTSYLDGYDMTDVSYVLLVASNISSTDGSSLWDRSLSFNVDYNDDGSIYVYLMGKFSYFIYYDSDGDAIGYTILSYDYVSASYRKNEGYWYFVADVFNIGDSVDMTAWYGYAFKSIISSNYYDKIYAYYFYLPSSSSYVMLDGNAGVSTIKNFFLNFFNSNYLYVDLSKYNLNFIYQYPFYKSSGYSTMWQYWFNSNTNEAVVPDDFDYITISDFDKGYYLVPISGCAADNYMLYYYSNNSSSDYKLYFSYYNFDSDSLSLEYNGSYYAYASVDYYLYSYSPLVDLSINSSNFSNILINVYQNSVLFDYFLYYNPSCYYVYSSNSSFDVSFSDDVTYTLSLTEQASMYSNYNVNGGNYVGSSTASSSTSNTLDNGTYDGYNLSSATSASDLLATATSSIGGITGTISGLVYMGTVFFTGLPSGMQSVLYSFFILGFVIVILKMLF